MIYTDNTERAMKIAYLKHNGAVDKGGVPYIFHPIMVAERMDDEDSTIVALLHDVVEDTDVTIDDIIAMGFNKNVVDALSLLTHNKDESYMDYIEKIGTNPIATKVKLSDLAHNSDFSRIRNNPELVNKLQIKYDLAKSYLQSSGRKK